MASEFHLRRTTRYTETACPPCPPPTCGSSCGCKKCKSVSCDTAAAVGCYTGAAAGGAIGTAICPGLGTLIGALIGAMTGSGVAGTACEAFKDK